MAYSGPTQPLQGDAEQILLVKIAALVGADVSGSEPPYTLWRKIVLALGGTVYGGENEQTIIVKAARQWGADAQGDEFVSVLLRKALRAVDGESDGFESLQELLYELASAIQTPSVPPLPQLEPVTGFSYGDSGGALAISYSTPLNVPNAIHLRVTRNGVIVVDEDTLDGPDQTTDSSFSGVGTYNIYLTNKGDGVTYRDSVTVSALGVVVTVAAPGIPQNLIATPLDSEADLSWDAVSGALTYKLYRDMVLVATVSAPTTAYNDATVTNGVTYSYTVSATNAGGESAQSDPATVTPAGAPFALANYGTVVFRANGADYDAATGTCTDGSGNGNDAVQATAGARPTLTTPVSAPAMTFDGGNDNLQSPYAGTLGDFTVFAAFGWLAGNPAIARILDKTYSSGFLMGCALTDNTLWGGGVRFGSNPYGTFIPSTPGRHVMFLRRSGSAITVGLDGNRSHYTGDSTALSNSVLGIGGEAYSPAQFFYGYLEDGFIFDSALTDDQCAAIIAHYTAGEQLTFGVAPVPYTFHGGSLGASFSDGKFEILLPDSPVAGQWVVYCHGVGEAEAGPRTEPLKASVVEAILAAGYGIASSIAHGQNFGNAASVADYEALCAYLVSNFGATKIVVFSQSMGGLAGLDLVSNGNVSQITGWFGIYPAADLAWMHDNGFSTAVEAAFPSYPTGADAQNPILRNASTFATRMRFYASAGDGTVTKADNSDAMAAHVSGTAIESTVVVCSGGHGDASHFQPSDVLSFLGRCFA